VSLRGCFALDATLPLSASVDHLDVTVGLEVLGRGASGRPGRALAKLRVYGDYDRVQLGAGRGQLSLRRLRSLAFSHRRGAQRTAPLHPSERALPLKQVC
jgi:hypothetical protein